MSQNWLYPGMPSIQALIELHLAHIGKAHENRPEVNLLGTLIGMVQANLGHAIVPSFALDECLRRGLDIAMLVEPAVYLDMFLVSRRGAAAKGAIAEFAGALRHAATRFDHAAADPAPQRGGMALRKPPMRRSRAAG